MKKLALVLGGGAAKGYAHIGVIKVLEKHGIKPDLIVGTSMGALVGGMYAVGKDTSYMEKLVSKFNSLGNFSLISTLFKGNILNIKKVTKILDDEFDSIKQEETISAPKNSDPVSPIKILAGLILKNKNPSVPPMTAAETKALSETSEHEM